MVVLWLGLCTPIARSLGLIPCWGTKISQRLVACQRRKGKESLCETNKVIINLSKNHQWMLKPLVDSVLNRIFTYSHSISHIDCYGLQQGKKCNTTMAKASKCHFLAKRSTLISSIRRQIGKVCASRYDSQCLE